MAELRGTKLEAAIEALEFFIAKHADSHDERLREKVSEASLALDYLREKLAAQAGTHGKNQWRTRLPEPAVRAAESLRGSSISHPTVAIAGLEPYRLLIRMGLAETQRTGSVCWIWLTAKGQAVIREEEGGSGDD